MQVFMDAVWLQERSASDELIRANWQDRRPCTSIRTRSASTACTRSSVFLGYQCRSFIVFAKPVYPQQLLKLVNSDHKINEDSQALVNISAGWW
jgi:hypothetical protein